MKTYYPYATELLKHTDKPRPSNEYNQVKVYDAEDMDKEIKRLKKETKRLEETIKELKSEYNIRLKEIGEQIDDYDSRILNDYGGGNVNWWHDYIREEIARCNDHWRQALKE